MDIDFRRATAEDASALARIHVDSWHVAYKDILPRTRLARASHERRTKSFRQSLAAGSEETYLALVAGEPVGFLTLGSSRDPDAVPDRTGEIWGMYIAPKHWRKGIGCFLCKEGEHMLRERGYGETVLWVLENNTQARFFYEAMGFHPDGAVKEIDLDHPVTAVRYHKKLQKRKGNDSATDQKAGKSF